MAAQLCRRCFRHPARFQVRGGRMKADKQHDLCPRCTRAVKNRQRAASLARRPR